MSKAFTKEFDDESDEHAPLVEEAAHAQVARLKNYITPGSRSDSKTSDGSCSPENGGR